MDILGRCFLSGLRSGKSEVSWSLVSSVVESHTSEVSCFLKAPLMKHGAKGFGYFVVLSLDDEIVFQPKGSIKSGKERRVFKTPKCLLSLLLDLSCMVLCGLSETQVSWLRLPMTWGTRPRRP